MTRTVYQKEHDLTDRSDVIFVVPKCSKIQISRVFAQDPAPDPTGGAYCESLGLGLHFSSRSLSWWQGTRDPLRNNRTPVLGPSIRPRFYG